MIKWKRPSGSTIETNDSSETVAYAKSLGWEEIKPLSTKPVKAKELAKKSKSKYTYRG